MGFLSPKVPNTVSDKKYAALRKSAGKQEARDGGMFAKKAVNRRVANSKQIKKSIWS
jgi:hypothetical protein